MSDELFLELEDTEWPLEYIDHERNIARAIVFDMAGRFYFVRVECNDGFGKAILIETAGGGVEAGEDLQTAVRRELKEELGVEVEVICKIGEVHDFYHRIHRRNRNNYFLCRVLSHGATSLTEEEREKFHLSVLSLSFDEAVREYERRSDTKLGKLIANRELPVLHRAMEIIDAMDDELEREALNHVFAAALEFGKNFRRPVAEIVERCCPSLCTEEKAALARHIEKTQDEIEEYFCKHYDPENKEANAALQDKGRLWVQNAYPWMTRETVDRAVSQGMYFAWRG